MITHSQQEKTNKQKRDEDKSEEEKQDCNPISQYGGSTSPSSTPRRIELPIYVPVL